MPKNAYLVLIPGGLLSGNKKGTSANWSINGTCLANAILMSHSCSESVIVFMAEMEKAILDYLYLNASLKSAKDIEQLRLNSGELHNNIN
jgi:hypothetical protein